MSLEKPALAKAVEPVTKNWISLQFVKLSLIIIPVSVIDPSNHGGTIKIMLILQA